MTRFVDVHVHPPTERFLDVTFAPFLASTERACGAAVEALTIDQIADHYRSRDAKAVLLGWDAETATGCPPLTSADVADMVAAHPDVFIGFGAVDPHKGAKAISGVAEAKRLGMRGLKFHPPAQRFDPADRRVGAIWEVAEELGLAVLVHVGYTSLGAGDPGGGGVPLAMGNPMALDHVAAEFPRLQVILAHQAWPWVDASIAVAMHKPNVWIDLSGWSPRRLTPELLDAIRGPLADRTLFGTDFPFYDADRWLAAWERLDMPDELTEKVLVGNATRLLSLD